MNFSLRQMVSTQKQFAVIAARGRAEMNPNNSANPPARNLDNLVRFDIMALGKGQGSAYSTLAFFYLPCYNVDMPTTIQESTFNTHMEILYHLHVGGKPYSYIKANYGFRSNNSVRRIITRYPRYHGGDWNAYVQECRQKTIG